MVSKVLDKYKFTLTADFQNSDMTECRVQIRQVGGLIGTWIALILPGRKLRSCPTLLANQAGTSVHHLRCYKVQLPGLITKLSLLFEAKYEKRVEESSLL